MFMPLRPSPLYTFEYDSSNTGFLHLKGSLYEPLWAKVLVRCPLTLQYLDTYVQHRFLFSPIPLLDSPSSVPVSHFPPISFGNATDKPTSNQHRQKTLSPPNPAEPSIRTPNTTTPPYQPPPNLPQLIQYAALLLPAPNPDPHQTQTIRSFLLRSQRSCRPATRLTRKTNNRQILIFIYGFYSNEGKPTTRAGWGVYWNP